MAYIEFLEGQKHSGNLTDTSDDLETFQDAGYLLTEDDLVVDIDVIGKEPINAMLSLFNIKTEVVWTTRGAHLYFAKPSAWRRAQGVCALGFKVEYKHNKNTKAVTVKLNGKERDKINAGVRANLPWFLDTNKQYKDILGLSAGDGRNNALYQLKRTVAGKDKWRQILTFVNKYVFAEPLPEDEMEQLLREEILPTATKDNEFLIADYLIKDLDYLSYGGRYYYRERGEEDFKSDDDRLIRIIYEACPNVPTRYVDEVKKQMGYRCKIIPNDTVFPIKLRNGFLKDGRFVPVVDNGFTPYTLDVEYDPDAEPVEIVDKYINHLTNSDAEYRALLMEILGHTLIVNPEFKRLLGKFFIFVGGGGNGKGTLLQIIRGILDPKNITGMSIKELADERYLPSLKGKLANLGDDIQDSAINDKDMKILKNISTCDTLSVRELYQGAETMAFTATLIFTSNHIIKSFEKGESYKRRVVWLPMFTKVKAEDKDPLFITKLTSEESIKYWLKLIVEGYLRLYEQNGLSESTLVSEFNNQYHAENNPFLEYLSDKSKEDFIDVPVRDVYDNCKEWCENNAIEYKQTMFKNTLEEVLNLSSRKLKRINGIPTKVFQEEV